jgi:hypothetical protein
MNRIITLALLCLCECCTGQNTVNTAMRQLQPEYLSVNKLHEWDFIKAKGNDLYAFSFREDSLHYVATDSLYKINVNDEMYILYYNSCLLRNTGFIIYGTYKNREVHIIQTGKILSCEACIINQKLLLKTVENLYVFAFDNPQVLNTDYFLFSLITHSLQDDFSVLSKASVLLDTLKIQLQTKLSGNMIFVNGIQDGKQITCTVKIEENNFVIPKRGKRMKWNDWHVFERKKIYPGSLTKLVDTH